MFLNIQPSQIGEAAQFLSDNDIVTYWANSYDMKYLKEFGYPRKMNYDLMKVIAKHRKDPMKLYVRDEGDWAICRIRLFNDQQIDPIPEPEVKAFIERQIARDVL